MQKERNEELKLQIQNVDHYVVSGEDKPIIEMTMKKIQKRN